jgi:hypothetical protein
LKQNRCHSVHGLNVTSSPGKFRQGSGFTKQLLCMYFSESNQDVMAAFFNPKMKPRYHVPGQSLRSLGQIKSVKRRPFNPNPSLHTRYCKPYGFGPVQIHTLLIGCTSVLTVGGRHYELRGVPALKAPRLDSEGLLGAG